LPANVRNREVDRHMTTVSASVSLVTNSISPDEVVLPAHTARVRRTLKHPRLMHYNRLIVGVVLTNLGVLAYGATLGQWWSGYLAPLAAMPCS
jgi:hypothetical protein